ncbi:MAG: hypothetical protein IJE01_02375 [Clostridia bacterium]|nr:hypothetical protein [Clostridia bacterium]
MKELINKLKEKLMSGEKNGIFIILAAVGVVLILISSGIKPKEEGTTVIKENDSEYSARLEEKISQIVTAVTGDKSPVVAVTLETGLEYVYANQNTTDSNRSEDNKGESIANEESVKSSEEYIIVKNSDGGESPLIITEKKPIIRGVAIVCTGINAQTEESIIASITSMLDISSRKISISQAK